MMRHFSVFTSIFLVYQLLSAVSAEDKYEPMVAFICGRPAVYRIITGWVPDRKTDCLNKMEDILAYCKKVYPDHNITNVVERSSLATIPDWPMVSADRKHSHRVRPFRCLVGGFQSDALLVPQHCEFDHRHDQSLCEGFSHWNIVADEACKKKGTHLESFGMLLNCDLGKFSGVEYVCCPNKTETNYHPPQDSDTPDNWHNSSEEDDYVEDNADDDDDDSSEDDDDDENTVDLYEAYLRGQDFPHKYNNEHKKFLAAKDRMKKNQQLKVTKLLQEWQAARDHVNEVRKSDTKTANSMAKEITERFQNLYAAYEQEDEAEKEQLIALHLQHVQTGLNEKKREAMDKYLKALDEGDLAEISKYLRGYIKAEEKDRLHTVNHFEHVKYSAPNEASHIRPFIVNHLHLSEQRIDQALEMLKRDPEIETKVRPEIDEFMKRFDVIANSIRDIVLPVPEVDHQIDSTTSQQPAETSNVMNNDNNISSSDESMDESSNDELDPISQEVDAEDDDDDISENEHDFERKNTFVAHHMHDTHHVQQSFAESATSSSQVGSTVGIVLGSVSVFVIIVVAIIMLRRSKSKQTVTHGYVEVDPSASPEERHVVNMQMNGYENPTYKYFEVQSNPKA